MIKRLLIGGALLVTLVGVAGHYFFTAPRLNIGAELPSAPALFETSLAAPITATADSFTITSNTVRGGGSLSGYNCFTIDEGSAQAEFVCGTASGTAITNVTRGISPSDGVSEVEDLKFAHRRGASVKITDFPIIQLLRNQNNGEATFENVLRYAGAVVPSGASDLADVGYVLSVVNGGTVNFDALVVAGTAGETLGTSTLVYFKSSDQRWWKVDTDDTATFQGVALGLTRGPGTAGASVANGGILLKGLQTGLSALTAGATYYASSSDGNFNTATSVLPIGVAKSTTELYFDPVMIGVPRLAFNNTFTGNNTFNATTTFTGMTVGFGTASTTIYTSGTSTFTINPRTKYLVVEVVGGGGGSSGQDVDANTSGAGAGAGAYARKMILASSITKPVTVVVGAAGTGTGAAGTCTPGTSGGHSTFDGFATSTGGVYSGCNGGGTGLGGTATGGDININGQPGSSKYGDGYGGRGGSNPLGMGGVQYTGDNAFAGTGYGAGASGGGFDGNGANGTNGVVIVTEYF